MSEYIVEGSPSEEVTDYLGVKYSVTHFERREEIVRCRDCVHYETDEVCDGCTLFDFADCSGSMADKFCAWGEMAENIIIGESYKQPSENDGEVIKNGGQYKFDGEAHTAVYAPYPLSVKASNPQGEVFVTGTTFEHDTREKLEADIEKLCTGILAHRVEHQKEYCNLHGLQPDKNHSCWSETQWLFPVMLHLLDRQEAITTSELCGDYTYMKADRDLKVREAQELQAKVDELTAERDQLSRDLTAEHALLLQFEYDNERLREAIDAMENGQFYAMYRDECAQLEALRAAQHDKPGT